MKTRYLIEIDEEEITRLPLNLSSRLRTVVEADSPDPIVHLHYASDIDCVFMSIDGLGCLKMPTRTVPKLVRALGSIRASGKISIAFDTEEIDAIDRAHRANIMIARHRMLRREVRDADEATKQRVEALIAQESHERSLITVNLDNFQPTISPESAIGLLSESLVEANKRYLRDNSEVPKLYDSSVEYDPASAEEILRSIPVLIQYGRGSAVDLAAWRVAELHNGEDASAKTILIKKELPSGAPIFLIGVKRGDGSIEYPAERCRKKAMGPL